MHCATKIHLDPFFTSPFNTNLKANKNESIQNPNYISIKYFTNYSCYVQHQTNIIQFEAINSIPKCYSIVVEVFDHSCCDHINSNNNRLFKLMPKYNNCHTIHWHIVAFVLGFMFINLQPSNKKKMQGASPAWPKRL